MESATVTGPLAGMVTCCSAAVKPVIATLRVQTPGARSAKAKLPSAAVIAVCVAVPWVAVTVAPGSGMPPPRTTPLSGAASAAHARKKSVRRTFMVAWGSLSAGGSFHSTVNHDNVHRRLAGVELQPQLLGQHGKDRGRRLARLRRRVRLGRIA